MNDSTHRHDLTPDKDLVARLGLDAAPRTRFSRRQWIAVAGGGAALLIAALWLTLGRSAGPAYVTEPVTRGSLNVTVSATGTLAPRNQVDVGAEVSGRIDELAVDYNDPVKKGQVIARINTDQLQAKLAQSRATLAQAEATLRQDSQTAARFAKLVQSNALSAEQLNTARGDLGRAEAGVALARATVQSDTTALSKATIYSPIDGIVLDRKVSVGQTVVAAMQTPVLFTLASDLSKMELNVDIDEADVGEVRIGADATFTVDAYPSRRFAAKLVQVRNAPQTVQGVVTYQGVLLVDNPGLLLKPGMTATAEIEAAHVNNALLVPNGALRFVPPDAKVGAPTAPQTQNGIVRGRVFVIADGKAMPRDLILGASDGRFTAILKGDLAAGDRVATDIASPKSR